MAQQKSKGFSLIAVLATTIVAATLVVYFLGSQKPDPPTSAEERAHIAAFGPEPRQSRWDGTYEEVERYLEANAFDPSSVGIENCSPAYRHPQEGWLVLCKWRGRQTAGKMGLSANWFVIRQGEVVLAAASDAYQIQ
jgi:hypothetical protein